MLSHRKNIVVDCDDVVANIRDVAYGVLKGFTGVDAHYRDFDEFGSMYKNHKLTIAGLLDLLKEGDVLNKASIEEHAVEVLHELRERGFAITLLTARGWHPEGEPITQAFFRDHGVEFDDMIFVDVDQSKSDVLRQAKIAPLAFLDDNPNHIEDCRFLSNFIDMFLMCRPWNLMYRHDSRYMKYTPVTDLYEFKRLIVRLYG